MKTLIIKNYLGQEQKVEAVIVNGQINNADEETEKKIGKDDRDKSYFIWVSSSEGTAY